MARGEMTLSVRDGKWWRPITVLRGEGSIVTRDHIAPGDTWRLTLDGREVETGTVQTPSAPAPKRKPLSKTKRPAKGSGK